MACDVRGILVRETAREGLVGVLAPVQAESHLRSPSTALQWLWVVHSGARDRQHQQHLRVLGWIREGTW